jgi:hypothetical protein
MKRASKIEISVAIVLLVVAAIGGFLFTRFPNHTDIRNLSGQTVNDVVLKLRDHQTDWAVTKRVASLRPGESLRVRHSHNDTRAVVEFAIAGRSFRHEEGYIDLWTGEGWRFDIHPNGTVTAGYDYAKIH